MHVMPDTELPPAEVIVDEAPMTGRFNMTMDATMLQLGAFRSVSVVRVYQWSAPTITLGYFQATAGPQENPFPSLPNVRRLSGGGAILHDQELTYSCVLPTTHPVRQDPSSLYTAVHLSLISLLRRCGIDCSLRSEFDAAQPEQPEIDPELTSQQAEPFLCFLRRNPSDIVHASGAKIVGSAQRRRKGITLQHGSILLSASHIIPSVPGIQELSPEFDAPRFSRDLGAAIAQSISNEWKFRSYSAEELSAFAKMEQNDSTF